MWKLAIRVQIMCLVTLVLLVACVANVDVTSSPRSSATIVSPASAGTITPAPQVTLMSVSSVAPGLTVDLGVPEGRVFYVSWPTNRLYSMDVSETAKLVTLRSGDGIPTVSPNGTRIAFDTGRGHETDTYRDIYIGNTDGSGLVRIIGGDSTHNDSPAWSPDSEVIAFVSDRGRGGWDIYTFDVRNRSIVQLTRDLNHEECLNWSPDGQRILFDSSGDNGSYLISHIYVIDRDGKNLTRLTSTQAHDKCPVWSPDSKHIVFQSDRTGNWEVYLMNSDGSDVQQITYGTVSNALPTWSPDGRYIAFESNREGHLNIYGMKVDGSDIWQITHNEYDSVLLSWLPEVKAN